MCDQPIVHAHRESKRSRIERTAPKITSERVLAGTRVWLVRTKRRARAI
jgi:hypothetical protein